MILPDGERMKVYEQPTDRQLDGMSRDELRVQASSLKARLEEAKALIRFQRKSIDAYEMKPQAWRQKQVEARKKMLRGFIEEKQKQEESFSLVLAELAQQRLAMWDKHRAEIEEIKRSFGVAV